MIPKISRGERMSGLLVYLAGPGRHNEHEEPHVVAGDVTTAARFGSEVLDREQALAVARHVDRPHAAFAGVRVPRGHVWHCSLSLRAEEGRLPDERWREIAEAFVARMGFDDPASPRSGCRWVAVRHGLSVRGNDHVHIAVDLVRPDGTKADVHQDFRRAQAAARALEEEFGLQRLDSLGTGRSQVAYSGGEAPAEARRQARGRVDAEHRADPARPSWEQLAPQRRRALEAAERARSGDDQPRWRAARAVRACAGASGDEAEFVRRMRGAGLLVRPRFAARRQDVVVGYSVALRPPAGERPIWYGGGSLAHDLSLPRLRRAWPDTVESSVRAVAEWRAAHDHRAPVGSGREAREVDPREWARCVRDVERLRERLRAVDPSDRVQWAAVARYTAAGFAAWSQRVEDSGRGPLARVGEALARSAELRSESTARPVVDLEPLSRTAHLFMAGSRMSDARVFEALLMTQLSAVSRSLHDMHRAGDELRRAKEISTAMRVSLVEAAQRMDLPSPQELDRLGAELDALHENPEPAPGPARDDPSVGRDPGPGERTADPLAREAAGLVEEDLQAVEAAAAAARLFAGAGSVQEALRRVEHDGTGETPPQETDTPTRQRGRGA